MAFIGWFLLNAAQRERGTGGHSRNAERAARGGCDEPRSAYRSRNMSLEEYGQEVTRTGRRCHLVTTDDRLVGMVNVTTLNSVPRHEWANMSVQGAMIPREKICGSAGRFSAWLVGAAGAADVNQMPVVSDTENDGAHIIG